MKRVRNLLIRLDEALLAADAVLNESQPANPGKIRIIWEKRPNGKRPQVVEWKRNRKLEWYPTRVSHKGLSKRAKSRVGFKLNHARVVEILEVVGWLMELRVACMRKIAAVERSDVLTERENLPRIAAHLELIARVGRSSREALRTKGVG